MSRATRMKVFIVSGFRPLTSSAHASDALSRAPVEVIAIPAAKPPADLCKNPRLDRTAVSGLGSVVVMSSSSDFLGGWGLLEAAALLQHLDFVAVRIFDEEKARDLFSVVVELDNLPRLQPPALHPPMLPVVIL